MKAIPTINPANLHQLFLGLLFLFISCADSGAQGGSPTTVLVNNNIPKTTPVIRSVKVGGVAITLPDQLVINKKEDDLCIELQQLNVDRYCFHLKNKNGKSDSTSSPFPQIRYTFLPGGSYELTCWTQTDGHSSERINFHFEVKESLYEKAWFLPVLVAYILLVAGAIIYFWSLYNIRQKLKLQHIRSRIAADLHDEVSSDLSSIAISMTTLERRKNLDAGSFSNTMRDIKQTLSEIQTNLSDTVWAIKPEKDTGKELFNQMRLFAFQMFASGDVQLDFQNKLPENKTLKISMDQRHNVYKIFKEVIHNIYKHAAATKVEINIYPHPEGIGLEITDNGVGFDPQAQFEGMGVGNYQWRAKESFIDFHLNSAPGKGTTIQMVIPQF